MRASTLSTGAFQTVNGGEIKNPTIRISIPLLDRKDVIKEKESK
jgi:hypothetical protein